MLTEGAFWELWPRGDGGKPGYLMDTQMKAGARMQRTGETVTAAHAVPHQWSAVPATSSPLLKGRDTFENLATAKATLMPGCPTQKQNPDPFFLYLFIYFEVKANR
jgi:hypothetical protein